jgi:hypothetical protein
MAVLLPDSVYREQWGTPKHLDANLSQVLALLFAVCLVAVILAALPTSGARAATIAFSPRQVAYLRRASRLLLGLAWMGYGLWIGVAVLGGVGMADLEAVLAREGGAIGELKAMARPVAGLTTFTQLGPLAVALGAILRRLGAGGRAYWSLFGLAAFRTLFYAERLALMEVAVPALIVAAVTAVPVKRAGARLLVQAAPALAGPAVWLLFAASEYTRSWVFRQETSSMPFASWVSLRFVGYYTTAFDNSAMYAASFPTGEAPPAAVLSFLFNAPLVGSAIGPGIVDGRPSSEWWWNTRHQFGNLEFTNTGSFLCSFGELGMMGALVYWAVFGLVVGRLYNALRRGGPVALPAYACLFVAILELPRMMYVAEGRAFPLIAALLLMAATYPRTVPAWGLIAAPQVPARRRPTPGSRALQGAAAARRQQAALSAAPGDLAGPSDPPRQLADPSAGPGEPPGGPRVLVVIPTLGTRSAIAAVFEGLARQTLPPVQVVVALQGDPALVQAAAARFDDLPVGIVRCTRGISAARNRGVGAATPDWDAVTFPDDDSWHAPEALERAWAALEPGGVVVGSLRSADGGSRWRIAERPRPLGRRTVWTHASEAGMVISREAWTRVGGFDETLGVGAATPWQSGEGTDWLLRALAAGVRPEHRPEVVLFEGAAEPSDLALAVERATRYARGTGRVHRLRLGPLGWAALIARSTARALIAAVAGSGRDRKMAWGVLRGRLQGLAAPPPQARHGRRDG